MSLSYSRPLRTFHAAQKNLVSNLNSALNSVELHELRALLPSLYCRIASKMLFFRSTNIVPLVLFRMSIAQLCRGNRKHNRIRYHSIVVHLPLGCSKLVCFCYKLIS